LLICKAQEILKPECTVVHEASFIIWQNFAATKQMSEFSFKHYLFFFKYDFHMPCVCDSEGAERFYLLVYSSI